MRVFFVLLFVFLQMSNAIALETSSESVSPFNKYSGSTNGINLFSGDALYSQPLVALAGRAGMSVTAALSYSSNIYQAARADNTIAPTSWVGLGWSFGYGSIMCNHNNTATTSDDDWFLISPQGVSGNIVKPMRLRYSYYETSFASYTTTWPDFSTMTPTKVGQINNIISGFSRNGDYGLVFEGTIYLDPNQTYTFYLNSDDGSRLYIDNALVVDNKGIHSMSEASGAVTSATLALANRSAGTENYHDFRVEFFQHAGGAGLDVRYTNDGRSGTDLYKRQIPDEAFRTLQPEKLQNVYSNENNPFERIVPQDLNKDGTIEGWIVTGVDGNKRKYGDLDFTDNRKATRFTFRSGEYVGTVFDVTPTRYPYQWDLSEIEDINGNKIKFYYTQSTAGISLCGWSTPVNVTYTRASYLKKIVNPEGNRIEFKLCAKGTGLFDSYTAKEEHTEDSMLKNIKVYTSASATALPITNIDLEYYGIKDADLAVEYTKEMLKSITDFDVITGRSRSKTSFTYNDDATKATAANPDYHYGALTKITDVKTGSSTAYTYTKQSLNSSKTTTPFTPDRYKEVKMGVLPDGNPFAIAKVGDNSDYVYVYNWDGAAWKFMFAAHPFAELQPVDMYVGNGYFVVRGGNSNAWIAAYSWDGEAWVKSLFIKPFGDDELEVYPASNFFAVRLGYYREVMALFNRNGASWRWTATFFPSNEYGSSFEDARYTPYLGNNFIATTQSIGQDWLTFYNWNGSTWDKSPSVKPFADDPGKLNVVCGDNFVVMNGSNSSKGKLSLYVWTGVAWVAKLNNFIPFPNNPNDWIGMTVSKNFIAVRGGGPACDSVKIFEWVGETGYLEQRFRTQDCPYDPGPPPMLYPLNNCFVSAVNYNNWYGNGTLIRFIQFKNGLWSSSARIGLTGQISNDPSAVFTLGNMFVTRTNKAESYLNAFAWDGERWQHPLVDYRPFTANTAHFKIAAAGNSIVLVNDVSAGTDADLKFIQKFQDNYTKPFFSYTVTQKTITDGLTGKAYNTALEYDNSTAMFDTKIGAAKYNKVGIASPGNGKVVSYFFNDNPSNTLKYPLNIENSSFDKLDGLVYLSKTFNENNKTTETTALSEQHTVYQYFKSSLWAPGIAQKRVLKTVATRNGVSTEVEYLKYDENNGMPSITRTKNSDEKIKLSKTVFAYENPDAYSDFSAQKLHMLVQPLQSIVYEKSAGGTTIEPMSSEIRSAQATTWSNTNGSTGWMPWQSFVWSSELNSTGSPLKTFVDFNPGSGIVNQDWVLTSSIVNYATDGTVVQTSDAVGNYSVVMYSNDNTIPIAKAINCQIGECLFTNFTENDIDDPHGTVSMTAVSGEHLYSDRALKITGIQGTTDQYGRTRPTAVNNNVSALGSKTFVLDFWARSDQVSTSSFIHLQGETSGKSTNTPQFSVTNIWKKFTVECTFPLAVTDKQYRVVLRPPSPSPWNFVSGTIFYDDVRVYPKSAMMTTMYHHPVWKQPVVALDANNNPGQLVVYDSWGRPFEWRKINKNNPALSQVVSKKDYHLMGIDVPPPAPYGGTKSGPVLTWSCDPDPDGDGITFLVEIYSMHYYTHAFIATVLTGTTTILGFNSTGVPTLPANTVYLWHVKARDATGLESEWGPSKIYAGSFLD